MGADPQLAGNFRVSCQLVDWQVRAANDAHLTGKIKRIILDGDGELSFP